MHLPLTFPPMRSLAEIRSELKSAQSRLIKTAHGLWSWSQFNLLKLLAFAQLRNCQKWRTLRRSKLHSKCDHFSARPANFSCGGPLGKWSLRPIWMQVAFPRAGVTIRQKLCGNPDRFVLKKPFCTVLSRFFETLGADKLLIRKRWTTSLRISTHAGERPRQEGVAKFGGFLWFKLLNLTVAGWHKARGTMQN